MNHIALKHTLWSRNEYTIYICRVGLFGRRHLLLLRVSCSLRSNHQAMPKITDTKDDIQNLKIQNNAHGRDVQKCDWLSEYVL